MIPFWCGVVHGRADLAEEREPGVQVEAVGVAILGDRYPFHQFHDEERPAAGRGPGVQHASDVGVVHQRQGLTFRLEAGQDVACVHPALDQLQRHLAADRPDLLGEIDRPHPPLADLLADLVTIGDDRIDDAGAVVFRLVDSGAVVRGGARRRRGVGPGCVESSGGLWIGREGPVQCGGRLVIGGEQGVEPAAQLGGVAGLGIKERPAVVGVVSLDGCQEQGFDALGIGGHVGAPESFLFLHSVIVPRGVSIGRLEFRGTVTSGRSGPHAEGCRPSSPPRPGAREVGTGVIVTDDVPVITKRRPCAGRLRTRGTSHPSNTRAMARRPRRRSPRRMGRSRAKGTRKTNWAGPAAA